MTARDDLLNHLQTAATTVCRVWLVTRKDGKSFGFTDHDQDLAIEGQVYRASAGMTAKAFQQGTGLSVDNSEAIGILSDASISEADIAAGRFDNAEVRNWLVNWQHPDQRMEQFRGYFGDITRSAGMFKVELRGQMDRLNQSQGRVYHKGCSAVLGDGNCRVDLLAPEISAEVMVLSIIDGGEIEIAATGSHGSGWFDRGRVTFTSGAASGLMAEIKRDTVTSAGRRLTFWASVGIVISPGDALRVIAGCDRRAETCRTKFANFANFRGFPHIPGEDWLTSYPVSSRLNNGGSLVQ